MKQTGSYPDLGDQHVVITGGASGIGAALVEGFVAQQAKVSFLDIKDGQNLAERLGSKYGITPVYQNGDIADTAQLQQIMQDLETARGPIKVLINNAANDDRHDPLRVDQAFWDWSMAINLRAYFFACQAAISSMQASDGGVIINFSSISYLMGNAGYPAYTTANGGITAMTRSLAREYGPDNIRVNALAPGWVMTDKQREKWAKPEDVAAHLERQCIPQELHPEDIVGPALFLASQASRMITGQCLAVDGGVVASG